MIRKRVKEGLFSDVQQQQKKDDIDNNNNKGQYINVNVAGNIVDTYTIISFYIRCRRWFAFSRKK